MGLESEPDLVAEKLEDFKNKFGLRGSPHPHQIEKSGNKVVLSVRKTPEDLGWPSLRVLGTPRREQPFLSEGTTPSAGAYDDHGQKLVTGKCPGAGGGCR